MSTKRNTRKLGPRVSVLFQSGQGQGKGARSQYVFMLKSVAERLGFEAVKDTTYQSAAKGKSQKARDITPRGSKGAKRIKVPLGGSRQDARGATAPNNGAKTRYVSVPVPANATLKSIKAFLSKASKKPTSFVSPDGITHAVTAAR